MDSSSSRLPLHDRTAGDEMKKKSRLISVISAPISATFRISLTSTDLDETYLIWFKIVQGPRVCDYFFLYRVRRPRHMTRNA